MNFKRIRQFLVVLFLVTCFLFSPIITLITAVLLSRWWSLSFTLTIGLVYCCWLLIDRHTDSQGGRWFDWLRRLSIWRVFTEYFPFRLMKSVELDPNRNYIFGYHPHGVFALGALGNLGTDATHFSTLFPGIRPRLMLLRLQFLFPFTRDLLLALGACCVSRDSCEYLLSGKCGQGNALVIVLGGVPEMHLTREKTMILYLQKRKGFVELALKHGASLVPVISFGENELYKRRTCYQLIPNGIPWGRWVIGHIPRRRGVVTVVGNPIHVNPIVRPTQHDIDQLHRDYLRSVQELFEQNKQKYSSEHIKLEII